MASVPVGDSVGGVAFIPVSPKEEGVASVPVNVGGVASIPQSE